MTQGRYIVICRDDAAPDGAPGRYVAATHRLFTAESAARYALTVAVSRQPRIVTPTEYLLICYEFKFEEQKRVLRHRACGPARGAEAGKPLESRYDRAPQA